MAAWPVDTAVLFWVLEGCWWEKIG